MTARIALFISLLCMFSLNANANDKVTQLSSPDGAIQVLVNDDEGLLTYRVTRDGNEVIQPSLLGMRFAKQHGLDTDLKIIKTQLSASDTTWEQPWGENRFVRDNHTQLRLSIIRQAPELNFDLVIKAFNDGIGFRYEVPKQSGLNSVEITEELTEFNMDQDSKAWWIPARKWNRYEYLYNTTTVDDMEMAHTPVTMRLPNGTHVSLHEAALVNYSGMSIEHRRGANLVANLAPRADGSLVKLKTPFVTPWRTIQIAEDAPGLINSNLILNLNEPNRMGDVSWFKPGKYVGIWWQQHIKDRTWGNDGIHAATTEATMEMMDFAK